MNFEISLFVTEILGTIAFAFSGAFLAIEKKMDLFGVIILGCVTAVGGGIVRDVIIGNIPPATFFRPVYILTAIATSVIVFLVVYLRKDFFKAKDRVMLFTIIEICDAIGLGAFTVVGVNTALVEYSGSEFIILQTFLGALTGVGGGVIRDVLAGVRPMVLCKKIYAIASIAGAFLYIFLLKLPIVNIAAMPITIAFVVLIRMLAVKYQWNLPVADID